MDILPGATHAPTLYPLGDTIRQWAEAALTRVAADRIIVVGCSVGGSCALEIAACAPERVAALVLLGTKARHRPEPSLHERALATIKNDGPGAAWDAFWAPLLSLAATRDARDGAKRIAMRQAPEAIARGVSVFHTRPSRDHLLPQLTQPVHFVTGADDTAPGLATCAAQAKMARQGHLHVIPDCGHYIPIEQPVAFAGILRRVVADANA